ncbi:MAG: DUF4118 domain-containing protein [Chitinivibrionales bacterium]|nr:DUF4118 domain-containing protein [Chitinivibrionales bacterium]
MNFWQRTSVRFALAPVAVIAGLLVRLALTQWVGPGLPTYVTFYPPVMLVAVVAGFWPGVLATACASLAADYWLLAPIGFGITSSMEAVGLVLFIAMGLLMSAVAGRYRHIRGNLENLVDTRTQELNAAYAGLKQQVELIDPTRARVIFNEMQRVLQVRRDTAAVHAAPVKIDLQWVPPIAGALICITGILVLLGWLSGVEDLKSILPGLATMKANTALCFVLLGAALGFRRNRGFRLTCATIAGAVAVLSIIEYLTGGQLGIDQILFRDPGNAQTAFAGRMAPATALGIIGAAIAILVIESDNLFDKLTGQICSLATGAIGLVALTGYLYGDRELYSIFAYTSLALPTAIAFIILALGLLTARPEGFIGVLTAPHIGAKLARRLLPAILVGPLILGWLCEEGVKQKIYSERLDTVLFALITIFLFSALI